MLSPASRVLKPRLCFVILFVPFVIRFVPFVAKFFCAFLWLIFSEVDRMNTAFDLGPVIQISREVHP